MSDDGYTAAPEAIPTADPATRVRTLGDIFRAWAARTSPRILTAALLVAVIARTAIGDWSWRDAAVVVFTVAIGPFVEWITHVCILHARPRTVGRFTLEMPNAKEHRIHHNDPSNLDRVLITTYLIPLHLTLLVGLSAGIGALGAWALDGSWLPLAGSGLVVAYGFLVGYEWTHFLMHSPYTPRSRYFRTIWKNHRLHHYKNEHHWFGVTSVIADTTLRTAPNQRDVEKSPTARALHGDTGSTEQDA